MNAVYSNNLSFISMNHVTNEKKLIIGELEKIILNKTKKSYLDIGSGHGEIFFWMKSHFKESIAIEPGYFSFKFLRRLLEEFSKIKDEKTIALFQKSWQNAFKENQGLLLYHFDLITSIHSIYAFRQNLEQEINNMLYCLKDNGVLFISCAHGNYDEDDYPIFKSKFNGEPVSLIKPYSRIKDLFPNVCQEYIIEPELRLRNIDEVLKNPFSRENHYTNLYFKFAYGRLLKEFSETEMKTLKSYLKRYEDSYGYTIPLKQRVLIFEKENSKLKSVEANR